MLEDPQRTSRSRLLRSVLSARLHSRVWLCRRIGEAVGPALRDYHQNDIGTFGRCDVDCF